MPVPLREPFFLRGRHLPLQRAVVMSLVLGGLGVAAGWIVHFSVIGNGPGGFEIVMGVMWSLTSAVLVYGPLNYWNRRPFWMTVLTIPVSFSSIYLFTRWLEPLTVPGQHGDWEFAVGFLSVLAVNGALLVRLTRPHLIAYAAFVLGGLIPIAMAIVVENPGEALPFAGMPLRYRTSFVLAALFGNWYVALMALWGIPFWSPPIPDPRLSEEV